MKILQINCVYNTGSTGKIVKDIHNELLQRGIESIVCYGRGEKSAEEGVYKTCGELYSKLNNLRSRFTGIMYGGCGISTHRLISIIKKEKPDSILAGLGGQTGLTLSMQLEKEGFLKKHGVRLIGTNVEAIDKAEDRQLFKNTMQEIGEPTVPSEIATDVDSAVNIADKIGYPVIVRPAFTLGGAGGGVAYNDK